MVTREKCGVLQHGPNYMWGAGVYGVLQSRFFRPCRRRHNSQIFFTAIDTCKQNSFAYKQVVVISSLPPRSVDDAASSLQKNSLRTQNCPPFTNQESSTSCVGQFLLSESLGSSKFQLGQNPVVPKTARRSLLTARSLQTPVSLPMHLLRSALCGPSNRSSETNL